MKPINRLRQAYKETKEFNANSRYRKDRELSYLAMRLFSLDCGLVSFNEIELMEYEVNRKINNQAIQDSIDVDDWGR